MEFNTNKKHGVIYADPPWTFKTYSNKGKDKSPERHYPCMSITDIIRLPVDRIAKDDAVLLMWVVDPLLDKAFEVMRTFNREALKFDPKGFIRKTAEELEFNDIKYDMTFWDNYIDEILTRIQKPAPRFADGGLV